MKIYNGEGIILGRLGSAVAKDALMGEEIQIVNAEKVIVSGNKVNSVAAYKRKRELKGYPLKSQTHSRLPEYYVRRSIRGMLPWKTARGKEAYKQIMCHRGIPIGLQGKEMITLNNATVKKLPTLKYITIGEICKTLGGKR